MSLDESFARLKRIVSSSSSSTDRWEALRKLAQTNLYFLCKAVLGMGDLSPRFHLPLCQELDKLHKPFGRRLDLWPRGHLKTHIMTIGKSIQDYLCDNNVRILLAGSSIDNSRKNLRKIKHLFESCTILHWLFPECIPDTQSSKWAENEIVLPRTKNLPETTFKAIGVGGHITGWHFDVLRKDDLIDEKTDKSPEVMEKIIDWHLLTKNLLESPTSGVDHLIGTRWSMGDLYQYIIDNEREYTVACVQAIQDNIPAWPERFHLEALLALREKEPYQFACSRPDMRVLLPDWTEQQIGKVAVGDSIMGWIGNRLVPSEVHAVQCRDAKLVKITLASGRVTYQTPDHRWYQSDAYGRWCYRTVDEGDSLVSCYKPVGYITPEQEQAALWLGGIIDGEAGIAGNHICIHQSIRVNREICERICNALDLLGVQAQISCDDNGAARWNISSRNDKLKLYHWCNTTKIKHNLEIFGTRPHQLPAKDLIVSMEPVEGTSEVVALTTDSGNYVVSGYLSRNCQQMNNPRDQSIVDFNAHWLRYYEFVNDQMDIGIELAEV
ncbi:terminase large subunit [Caudoviricetes sp.]|nr:terminase large subunit [Caudoviricetes sp.]